MELDNRQISWTSIDPLAYAEASDAKAFYPLILIIGVCPETLCFDGAVTTATALKKYNLLRLVSPQ